MASYDDYSKLITPLIPSLFHLAVVHVAVPLFREFGYGTLLSAWNNIQSDGLATPKTRSLKYLRAKESLLFVPRHLREDVLKAVKNMHYAVSMWRKYHSHIFGCKFPKRHFYWTSSGTMDITKTVECLVMDKDIEPRKRFILACTHSLGDSMKSLWAEVEAEGEAEDELPYSDLELFWIRWVREGSVIPWPRALRRLLLSPQINVVPEFSCFFKSLRPSDRETFLPSLLREASLIELQLCLPALTRKEEEVLLKTNIRQVLRVYLEIWPLESQFLDIAAKVWDYVDRDDFCFLLKMTLRLKMWRKDNKFNEIFEGLWHMSSGSFREYAKEWSQNKCKLIRSAIKRKM